MAAVTDPKDIEIANLAKDKGNDLASLIDPPVSKAEVIDPPEEEEAAPAPAKEPEQPTPKPKVQSLVNLAIKLGANRAWAEGMDPDELAQAIDDHLAKQKPPAEEKPAPKAADPEDEDLQYIETLDPKLAKTVRTEREKRTKAEERLALMEAKIQKQAKEERYDLYDSIFDSLPEFEHIFGKSGEASQEEMEFRVDAINAAKIGDDDRKAQIKKKITEAAKRKYGRFMKAAEEKKEEKPKAKSKEEEVPATPKKLTGKYDTDDFHATLGIPNGSKRKPSPVVRAAAEEIEQHLRDRGVSLPGREVEASDYLPK